MSTYTKNNIYYVYNRRKTLGVSKYMLDYWD